MSDQPKITSHLPKKTVLQKQEFYDKPPVSNLPKTASDLSKATVLQKLKSWLSQWFTKSESSEVETETGLSPWKKFQKPKISNHRRIKGALGATGKLSSQDLNDWVTFIETGKLPKLDEEKADAFLQAFLSGADNEKIAAFLKDHFKALAGMEWEDAFALALNRFMQRMDQKFKVLAKKNVSELTADDMHFIESMAILLGRTSQLGIQDLLTKKNSPQERLVNQLGIWNQMFARLQQQFGYRPAAPGPRPTPQA